MLHSTLPRAFLTPGSNYLGGYYSEELHPYPAGYVPVDLDPYSRIGESHHVLTAWKTSAAAHATSRPCTPCPLDLSLKPPPTPGTPKLEDESIEVDDEEDRRLREELQKRLDRHRFREEEGRYPLELCQSPYEQQQQQQQQHQLVVPKEELMELELKKVKPYPSKFALGQKLHPNQVQTYQQQLFLTPQGIHGPMTPPSTPSPPQCPRRRPREEESHDEGGGGVLGSVTPKLQSATPEKSGQRPKKKHARRLKFDEDTSSPVSGTVILGPDEAVVTGDIDPAFNIVEVTEEARAELAKIENRLGPYQCKLCRQLHEDAFQLAQHRCSRIAHVEYRCPECDKRFSCPANLASHRRWHKPRLPPSGEAPGSGGSGSGSGSSGVEIPCTRCDAKFTRQATLRKHLATQHPETNNNDNVGINNNNNNNNNNINNNNNNSVGSAEETSVTGFPVKLLDVAQHPNISMSAEMP